MFKKRSSNSLQISSSKAMFIFNGQEMPGIELQATITAISLGWDKGNKDHKIKAGETMKIEIEGTGEDGQPMNSNWYFNLNNFLSKKFLCVLPNLESPFITCTVKPGSVEGIPTIFVGYREEAEADRTIWAKQKFSFDESGDLFDKQTKETTTAAEILEKWCDMFTIPFVDTREADKAKN